MSDRELKEIDRVWERACWLATTTQAYLSTIVRSDVWRKFLLKLPNDTGESALRKWILGMLGAVVNLGPSIVKK